MEKMAPCDSIEEEPKCENFVINILREQPPPEWPECCIYRVPKQLRKVNEEAYNPKLVSIGPFHHGKNDLKDMENHKLRYWKHFLERTQKSEEDLRKIINEDYEVKIRHCYSETFQQYTRNDFVTMILLDAIFIIELFLKVRDYFNDKDEEAAKRKRKKAREDYILRNTWLAIHIHNDLILLENQLPFFVLQELYIAAFCDSSNLSQHQQRQEIEDKSFLKLSQDYFCCFNEKQKSNIDEDVKHFTDLVRYLFYFPKLEGNQERTESPMHLCSATELDEAGLKLEVKNDRQLLHITFPDCKCLEYCPCFNLSWLLSCLPCLKWFPYLERMQRVLEVPCFEVEDNTECLLRNLMALEQCHYPRNAYVCNYVQLLDDLINDEKDVALLVDKKVIVHHLGSNTAVATLINNLCNEILFGESCYLALFQDIGKYRDNPWNGIMATMKRVYFRDFWRGAATIVGLVVLVFTLWNFLAPLVSTTLRLGDFFQFFF